MTDGKADSTNLGNGAEPLGAEQAGADVAVQNQQANQTDGSQDGAVGETNATETNTTTNAANHPDGASNAQDTPPPANTADDLADKDEQNQQTDSPPTNQSEDEQDSKSDKDNDQFEGFDNLDEFEPSLGSDLEPVYEIPVHVAAVLGKASIPVSDLMQLRPGQTIELDRRVGEAIDIYVNDRLVARGEVVMVNENLGISMTEIIKMDEP